MAEENFKSLFHFEAKGSDSGSEHRTSAVAGLLYGDSSHAVHIPDPDEIVKSFIGRIEELFNKIRNSENGDEDIAKFKTTISNIRETLDIIYKSEFIKENDLDFAKTIIDKLLVSLDKMTSNQ